MIVMYIERRSFKRQRYEFARHVQYKASLNKIAIP